MKLDRLITVITAMAVATTFDLLSVAKPAAAIGVTGLTDNNTLITLTPTTPLQLAVFLSRGCRVVI